MNVLHVTPNLSLEWGGPTKVVTGLTKALAQKGVNVSVVTLFDNYENGYLSNLKPVDIRLFSSGFLSKIWTSYSSSLAKELKKEVNNFDLIHIHEMWHYPNFAAYKAARYAGKNFIITVHGQLKPWCLSHKSFRKKIYSVLIQRNIMKKASAIHVFTDEEAKSVSNYINNGPIIIIPNGINDNEFKNLPDKKLIENSYPQIKGQRVILFMGRIDPVKGLDILAKSFSALLKKRHDIHLLIVGPGENKYKSQIIDILRKGNALNNATFTGMLTGNEKIACLSRADIFVLPSYSEGFSISILEAMACGVPVVITKQCNFPEVEKIGAGKIVDIKVEYLSEAIIELLDNPLLCKEMGNNGKRLVAEKYTWDNIADQMINVYKGILSRRRNVRN